MMRKTVVFSIVWVLGLAAGCAQPELSCDIAAGVFEPPVNLGAVVNSRYHEGSPCISSDGLTLYFDSIRPDGAGNWDIWVTKRKTVESEWDEPEMLPPPINTQYADAGPCISADGLTLYFASSRPGGLGSFDLWITKRSTTNDSWDEPTNLGPIVNGRGPENHPSIAADGLSLYFDSVRPNASGNSMNNDLYVTHRATTDDQWDVPVNLGSAINTDQIQYSPDILPDGLTMFFDSRITNRDLWMTTRQSADDNWAQATSLEPPMNTGYIDTDPSIWVSGCVLYFVSSRPGGQGGFDIWQATVKQDDATD